LALYQAHHGEFSRALATLQAAAKGAADPAVVEREIERLQALILARDAFLSAAVKNGKKLRYPLGGKSVLIKPTDWKDGVLELKPTRTCDLPQLHGKQLNPEFLALNWKKLPAAIGPDWLYGYVSYLAGNERWQRALRDTKSDPTSALEAHGDWMSGGELYEYLKRAESDNPASEDFDKLRELCNTFFKAMPLAESEEFFRDTVLAEIRTNSEALTIQDFLHTRAVTLHDGSTRLTYAFENPDEFLDFKELPKVWLSSRESKSKPIPEGQQPPSVKEGALTFSGDRSYGHRLQWKGPIKVKCTYELIDQEVDNMTFFFWIGLWDTARKPWLRSEFHTLVTQAKSRKNSKRIRGEGLSTAFGKRFESILSWDGKKAYLSLNGSPNLEAELALGAFGNVVFWSESQFPIHVHELVIEGTVEPSSLKRSKDQWIDAKMKSLGFTLEVHTAGD
ncbi:MAG: hypothetical protein JKY61_01845, partial [Planctomycetes bacterium]|nr:hypothetical protein [Planctomycetota bacterium]